MHALLNGLVAALWATLPVLAIPAIGYADNGSFGRFGRVAAWAVGPFFIFVCAFTAWWGSVS